MPRIRYEHHKFKDDTIATIEQANAIIDEYTAEGYTLTLRQVYYQMVARDIIPNTQQSYKRLGDVISKARRAGLVDWNAIVDRTRSLRSLGTWDSPERIVQAVAQQFRYDWWANQPHYIEVWFEKDALLGVFERAANGMRVPFFSCRGYTSDSEVWAAAQRLRQHRLPVVLHFGDHDPSGIDMTRDIEDRLHLFGAGRVQVKRIALNMDQVEQYDPPPNPAKETDSRFSDYSAKYGDESWELDALEPRVLNALVRQEVMARLDADQWEADAEREREAKSQLQAVSNRWAWVTKSPTITKEAARIRDNGDLDHDDTEDTEDNEEEE